MAVKSDKLGPGWLRLGEPGSELELGVGLRSIALEFETDEGDLLPVLSGDEIDEGDTETYKLTGSLLQSYDSKSFIVWSHLNAGFVVPFEFRPDRDKALIVRGEVQVRRLNIGGDVRTRATSDFEWPGRGGMPRLYDGSTEVPTLITTYVRDSTVTGEPPAGVDPADPSWD